MFRTIASKIQRDKDESDRAFTIDIYTRVLEGALYDHLPFGFHFEKQENGDYVPLRERRPSVRYNICRGVVDDSVSLLFSEGHFPSAECEDDDQIKDALADLVKECCLNEVMLTSATMGSVGSVAIHIRALKQKDGSHRLFIKPHRTKNFTPTFDPQAPDTLIKLREQYKVKGHDLADAGYDIPKKYYNSDFWFRREWDDQWETWFLPWLVIDPKLEGEDVPTEPRKDTDKSVRHALGFVPWVWVRNLPGDLRLVVTDKPTSLGASQPATAMQFSDFDGCCTFAAAIDAMVEIDYQLSQSGRGLKYSMDPLLLMKEPAAPSEAEIIKGPTNALIVSEKGGAELLEIEGSAFAVVLEYVRAIREYALEQVHGNKANADKLSAAQSGRALELMHQTLIWLADRLRASYGEGALLSIMKMALAAHQKYPLTVLGEPWPKLNADAKITLHWPTWFHPTAEDLQSQALTLKTLTDSALMSKETAVGILAPNYDIEDPKAEFAQIQKDVEEASQRAIDEAAQIKASTTLPT